ncbi:MAG: aspartate kinase [Anaerolineae bacterium]
MIVMKFGGTSVGSGARIAGVADITAQTMAKTGNPPVIVVSAMSGVTDYLVKAANLAARGERSSFIQIRSELQAKHEQAITECVTDAEYARSLKAEVSSLLNWLETLCQSIATLGELTPRGMDVVSGMGERLSARITAAALVSHGIKAQMIEATELVVTDDTFGSAVPKYTETTAKCTQRLVPLLEAGIVPVVTGFIGATVDGIPTTLGRGGSDYSATILGRCLPADEVWIWTDVNGVMTADPRIVPDAKTLTHISYAEIAELAFFGAKVLHPKTIQPVVQLNIPIRVLNSFEPQNEGTLVSKASQALPVIKGITAIRNLSMVTVTGSGMLGVPGVAGRVFSAVARSGASALMITQSSSEQNICFVVKSSEARAAVKSVEKEFELEMVHHDVDAVNFQDQVAIIAVVGAGATGNPDIAGQVFSALAAKAINIVSIAQGSSDYNYNLSIVVSQQAADDAVRAIHSRFHLDQA